MEQEDSRQGQGGNSPAPAAYSYSNLVRTKITSKTEYVSKIKRLNKFTWYI